MGTGASSGIGEAVAMELSKQGASIIISSRNADKLEQVKEQCHKPDKVEVLKMDLDDFLNVDKLVQKAIALFGKIDILINNGGISQRSLLLYRNYY